MMPARMPRQSRSLAIAALLLPALLYRALIPAGFMPTVGADGALTLEFCPGETSPAVSIEAIHGHAHHGDRAVMGHIYTHESTDPSSPGQQHVPCPYALSATPALAPAIAAEVHLAFDVLVPRASDATDIFSPSIVRAQSSRAPPVLL